jgi:hypothetical protein
MAGETNPVRVVIEIVDNFSDELAKLEAKLDKLDAKAIDVDLDIEDNGDIDSTRAQLDSLEEIINAILDIDTIGEAEAMAIKQMLERDMHSTLHVDTERDLGVGPGDFAPDEIRSILGTDGRTEDFWPDGTFRGDNMFPAGTQGFTDPDFLESLQEVNRNSLDRALMRTDAVSTPYRSPTNIFDDRGALDFDAPRFPEGALPGDGGPAADFGFNFDFNRTGGIFGANPNKGNFKGFRNIAQKLNELRPSLRTFTNLIALVIPLMVTLAGAAIGVAAAFGAVATSLGAIVGIGLLGWGDSATESLQNVREAATQTAKDIANVFQPLGNVFQPILEQWMSGLPNLARELVDPLEGMMVFADDLEGMGRGLVDWFINVITVMQNMESEAVSVANRAGSALGSFLIETMAAMLKEVNRNQDAYVKIGEILVDFAVILFNVFKAVTFAIAQFEWLFDLITGLTNLISGQWLGVLLATVGALFAIEAVLALVNIGLVGMALRIAAAATGLASKFIPNLIAAQSQMWALVGATTALQKALVSVLALSGIAAFTALAAPAIADALTPEPNLTPGVGGGRGSGGAGNTFINVEGDVGRREADRILDEVGPAAQNEMSISAAREK